MKQKKEVRITLRLTREQYDSIAAKAETAQMPVGAYVRAAALRQSPAPSAAARRWCSTSWPNGPTRI